MNSFQFQAMQVLNLSAEDHPTCRIEGHQLTLTATRNGEQIIITAPITNSSEVMKLTQQQPAMKMPYPARPQLRKSTRRHTVTRDYPRGEQHPKAKLTEQDIKDMREIFADPGYIKSFRSTYEAYIDLAKTYKIHYTTVYKIVNGQSWKHVANV
jgi:hypothetical protein